MLRGHFRGPRFDSSIPLACLSPLGLFPGRDIAAANYRKAKITSPNTCRRVLRKLIGLPGPDKAPTAESCFFLYGAHVEPIFVSTLLLLPWPDKQKGRLRLDSYECVMRGGKDGPVMKAGNAKGSELFHRVTLSPSTMTPCLLEGKRPLSANETKLLELWIAAGASSNAGRQCDQRRAHE